MRPIDRRLYRARNAAPLFVVIALHAWASGAWPVDLLLVLAILFALLLRWRVTMDPLVERILALVALLGGGTLGWLHKPALGYGPGTLARGGSVVAVAMLLVAASRQYVMHPWRGYRLTLVIGLVALAACGFTRLGPTYGAFAIVYVASSLLILRLRDAARSPWRDLGVRERASTFAAMILAACVATASMRVLPHWYDAAARAFERAYRPPSTIGFSDSVALGSLRNMLHGDDEVLRLSGDTDYLRGDVYDRYHVDGTWSRSRRSDLQTVVSTRNGPATPKALRVRRVGGEVGRYFFPLRARNVGTEAGVVYADAFGVVRVATRVRANLYDFEPGDRDALAVHEPTPDDLTVPDAERATLARIAEAWTRGATTPAEKLARIHDHLKTEYTYSLDFVRDSPDPLLDFLESNKLGYCMYFGSAMVLLARSVGVPARLVAGYRVAEKNPLSGEFIVREDNAHAWAEAWLGEAEGGWTTYDATPASEVVQNLPHAARVSVIVSDAIAAGWTRFVLWFERLTLGDILIALAATTALWIGYRALRRRGAVLEDDAAASLDPSKPLDCLPRFELALARRGFTREAWEPLEAFATRLKPPQPEAAALLEDYVALRYGGVGDVASVSARMDAFARNERDALTR